MAVELRDVDLALASYPESEWAALAAPVLLARLRDRVGIDADESYGATRRASYLAAAAGDPESGDDPDGPAVLALVDELHTRERAAALFDAVRSELGRATAARLPRVEHVLRELLSPPVDDPLRTWRLFCSALYTADLADGDDEQPAAGDALIGTSPARLLGLSVACQSSISIVQWGLGALGPDLARTYGLSAAGLGALISASAFGNAAALVGAGVAVDRFGPRLPLLFGGVVTGILLAIGGYAPGVAALAVCLLLSGIAGSLISVAGTMSVFHGFPADRRGAALGVRQMSVAAGGLVASFMLPGLAALGGIGLALGACGLLTAVTSVAFALASPSGPLHDDELGGGHINVRAVLHAPGMLRLLAIGFLLVCALTAILTFIVPAARASGISTAGSASLFTAVSLSAMAARIVFGRLADRDAGNRRRATLRDVALLAAVGGLVFWFASGQGLALQLVAVAFFAFGALGFNGLVYAIAGELVGPERSGQAVGLAATVLFGGGALAAIPLGFLADSLGYRALWPAAAALAACGALLTLGLPRTAPQLP